MNLAFSGIVLFLIFSSGIVFRRGYYFGEFSQKYIKTELIDEVSWSIIPGLLINIGSIFLFEWIAGYKVDMKSLGLLITGFNDTASISSTFANIENNLRPIALYFVLSWIASFLLGRMSLQIIRFLKLDHKFQSLRFANHWYYFFSGEYLEISKQYDLRREVDFLLFEVWADMGGGKLKKYTGFVDEFILSKDGGLETIYLLDPEESEAIDAPGSENQDLTEAFPEKENEKIEAPGPENQDLIGAGYLMIPGKSISKINMWPVLLENE